MQPTGEHTVQNKNLCFLTQTAEKLTNFNEHFTRFTKMNDYSKYIKIVRLFVIFFVFARRNVMRTSAKRRGATKFTVVDKRLRQFTAKLTLVNSALLR